MTKRLEKLEFISVSILIVLSQLHRIRFYDCSLYIYNTRSMCARVNGEAIASSGILIVLFGIKFEQMESFAHTKCTLLFLNRRSNGCGLRSLLTNSNKNGRRKNEREISPFEIKKQRPICSPNIFSQFSISESACSIRWMWSEMRTQRWE